MDATGFFYGEHHFTALLYLYPQYGTAASMDFLARAVSSPLPVRIIGKATHDFNGTAIPPASAADAWAKHPGGRG